LSIPAHHRLTFNAPFIDVQIKGDAIIGEKIVTEGRFSREIQKKLSQFDISLRHQSPFDWGDKDKRSMLTERGFIISRAQLLCA
jgi:hypothetical protein